LRESCERSVEGRAGTWIRCGACSHEQTAF